MYFLTISDDLLRIKELFLNSKQAIMAIMVMGHTHNNLINSPPMATKDILCIKEDTIRLILAKARIKIKTILQLQEILLMLMMSLL